MKATIVLILLISSHIADAHNMTEDIKLTKIKQALSHYSKHISDNDITLEFSEYLLTPGGILDKFEDGDQDIEEFFAYINTGTDKVRVNCDIVSGYVEDTSFSTHNYIIYKNCTLKSLTSYKVQQIDINYQTWPGNIY